MFRELVRAAESQELSYLEVCRRSGLSLYAVSKVMRGAASDLQLDTYLALAGALGQFRYDNRASRMSLSELTAVRVQEWCERLHIARSRSGMSQREVAGKAGVTQAQVSQWERGLTMPRVCSYLMVAEVVGLRV